MRERSPPTPDFLHQLPRELAILVVLNLDTHHSLINISLVSKAWKSVAYDPLVWRNYFHRNPGWRLLEDEDSVEDLLAFTCQDIDWFLPSPPRPDQDVFSLDALEGSLDPIPWTTPVKQTGDGEATPQRLGTVKDLVDESVSSDDGSNAVVNWWTSGAASQWRQRHSNRRWLMDRLDWRKVYAERYRMAARWGQVGASRADRRHYRNPSNARRRHDRHINEDWDDSDEEGEGEGEGAYGEQGDADEYMELEDPNDEVAIARRRAEEESHIAAATADGYYGRSHGGGSEGRWTPGTARPAVRSAGTHGDSIYCIRTFPAYQQYAPSNGHFVTGSKDTTIRIWDIKDGNCLSILKGHAKSVLAIDICPRGEMLVSGSSDSTFVVWSWFGCKEAWSAAQEGRSWKPELIARWHCYVPVMDVRLSEKYLALGLRSGHVRCYRRAREGKFQKLWVCQDQRGSLNDMKFGGDTLVCGFAGGDLVLLDVPTGRILRTITHAKGIACVDIDGDYMAAGASDHVIRCYRVSTGQLLLTLRGHEDLPRSLHLDAQGGSLISVGYDGIINVWDVTLLLDHEAVEHAALGDSWRSLARQYREQRRWIEEDERQRRINMDRIRREQARKRRGGAGAHDDRHGGEESQAPDEPSAAAGDTAYPSSGPTSSSHLPAPTSPTRDSATAPSAEPAGAAGSTSISSEAAAAPAPAPLPPSTPLNRRPLLPSSPSSPTLSPARPPAHTRSSAGSGAGFLPALPSTDFRDPPPPHPLADPPKPYKPRYSTREMRRSSRDPGGNGNGGAPPSRPSRIFDVAYDGKRIITVGEGTSVRMREFMPSGEERFSLKWEVFR